MSQVSQPAPTPAGWSYLGEPLSVGDPSTHGSLTVYPLTGPAPAQEYVSFSQGRAKGVSVKELDQGASVNDIVIENPTDTPVLLFEGEEVLGAQQNRTFDATILVAQGSKLQIPVSCVEAGRWDGSRSQERFSPAPQAAHPELRRQKAQRVQQSVELGGPARADQSEVWDSVAAKADRMGVESLTGSLHDVYEGHRDRLAAFREEIPPREDQSGALVAIGERFVVCDWVSRPEVFASLYDALLQGYALDALELDTIARVAPPSQGEAEGFLSLALQARASERDGIGLGREVRFAESSLVGTGLTAGSELVQLTVHNGEVDGEQQPSSPRSLAARRVRRPSRRRSR